MTTTHTGITINGQLIPWSFVHRVKRELGNEWDDTIDLFWRARNAKAPIGVVRYVSRALVRNADGRRWADDKSAERENGQMESLREWWETLYERKTKPTSVGEILRELAGKGGKI